jgi:RNA polymerase sigma factor (sigma-70 family)
MDSPRTVVRMGAVMCKSILYVVDDDLSVRRSMQRLLSSMGYSVLAFAGAREFLASYDGRGPGCLIVDLCLPDISGLDVLAEVEQRNSPLGVVFISGHGDIATTVTAMRHGALDFLTKPFNDEALLAVVTSALERSAERWAEQERLRALRQLFETLTPREREVCRLVAAGYLNKQTAYELGTAEKTVKVHRARVMAKLQVASVAELVRVVDHLTPTRPLAMATQPTIGRSVYAVA